MRYLVGFVFLLLAHGLVAGCGTPTQDSPCDPPDCDDANECTWDICNSVSGCRNPPVDDDTACAVGRCIGGQCVPFGSPLPCSEGGIRAAIRMGGGPVTFDCDGSEIVFADAEIIIDNDVILDGEGKLAVNGDDGHRVFRIEPGVEAQLIGITVEGGKVNGDDGGGILNNGHLTLLDSTVSRNEAARRCTCCGVIQIGCSCQCEGGYGGGIRNVGELRLVNGIVSSNNGYTGAGIANSGTMTLIDSSVSANVGRAGAIYNGYYVNGHYGVGTMSVVGSAVSGNSMHGIVNRGAATLIDSTVSANTANVCSGIANWEGELTLTGCTISGNVVEYSSGRICNAARQSVGVRDQTFLTLTNTTVSENSTSEIEAIESAGGVVTLDSSTVIGGIRLDDTRTIVTRTIVVGACALGVHEGGYNIESPGNTCGFDQTGDQPSVPDPMLGPLQDNGGPTETHALEEGSPAINQIPVEDCLDADGAPLAADQRGEPRPETGGTLCDVGAFERQPEDP